MRRTAECREKEAFDELRVITIRKPRLELAIRDLPDVVAYLKCDARASDAQRQMMIEMLAACVVSLGR